MQQQNETTNSDVHVKVEYNQEYRRFVVETLSFAHLETTIRSLLNIDAAHPIKIQFLDDEKDWVLLTSDAELTYAVELSASLLRLSVKSTVTEQARVEKTEYRAVPFPRGGRRGGRGGCGGGRRDPAARVQFFEGKLARLTEKHVMLSTKMAGMPEDKARALSWRVAHLENKIENIKWKKERFEAFLAEQPPKQEEATKLEGEETAAPTAEPFAYGGRGRGGCRRGGRGGCQRWMNEGADTHPLFEALIEKKAELRATRAQGGTKEEIQAKWEALQEAKTSWREAKRALIAARRTQA